MTKDKLNKIFDYWLDGAQEDLATSKDIAFKANRYSHSLFFLHLATEKLLKAYFVKINNKHAPFTHNLLSLCNQAKIELDIDQHGLLAKVNEFNLESRYPEDVRKWKQQIDEAFCQTYISKIEDFHRWIFIKLKSMP